MRALAPGWSRRSRSMPSSSMASCRSLRLYTDSSRPYSAGFAACMPAIRPAASSTLMPRVADRPSIQRSRAACSVSSSSEAATVSD